MPTTREPAVLYLRVAPQLRQALQRAAAAAGLSMTAWSIHVLAAAVGTDFYRAADGVEADGSEGGAIPDDVPVTVEDHRRVRRLAEAELRAAKTRWFDESMHKQHSMAPDEVKLEWYRTVFLPRVGDPDRYKFRRSRGPG